MINNENTRAPAGGSDLLKLAQKCGAAVYRNRAMPDEPAVAFGNEGWAKFCAALAASGHQAAPSEPQAGQEVSVSDTSAGGKA